MRSGSGSNFVGEAKELGQALKEMDKQVKLFLETQSWLDYLGKKSTSS